MKRFLKFFISTFFLLPATYVFAEVESDQRKKITIIENHAPNIFAEDFINRQPGVLTLSELLRSVEKSYPLVLAAEKILTEAEYRYLAAQGAFDLQFKSMGTTKPFGFYQNNVGDAMFEKPTPLGGTSFFAGYRMGRGNFPSYDLRRATNDYGEIRAGAIVPLVRNREIDKNRADIKKAEIDQKLAELSIRKLKIEVIREATKRYWKWVGAGQEYLVYKDLLAIAKVRQKQVADRIALGDLPKVEATENDRAILQRESQLVTAERELQKAAIDLSLFLRTPDGTMILPNQDRLPIGFPEPISPRDLSLEESLKLAFLFRPEVLEYEHKRNKVAIDRELGYNSAKPQVDLVVATSQDFGPGSITRAKPELEASLILNLPVQTRRPRGEIGAAEAKMAQLDQELQFAKDKISTEVQDALSEVITSYKRVGVTKSEVELARKLETLERERFFLGDSNLLFVNIREQTSSEAAIREIKALLDHHSSLANFQAATAKALQDEKSP
ncbi:TolC-like outermembrane protein [Leptospira ryugenii]|uniref:TolC-like outermembrane protein n=1 Tax=Leptospira ryugenii TaxID=1917863 RepID=A0A2P2E2Q4_9LEPT|nr:TolC family protein [Leptospira ryugenii]GBF51150.1 TolC-like outermembrane protein [Leptospira ryugenii]